MTSPRFISAFAALVLALTVPMHGGNSASRDSKKRRVYEDSEVRIAIPPGWIVAPRDELSGNRGAGASLGNSVSEASGKVVLEKADYVLGIAYHTDHASGIEGGRFIEIFNIPWPNIEDLWTCSLYLRGSVYPASRILTFTNLVVDSGDDKARENCGIRQDLGSWKVKDGSRVFEGERRWFGGYFTTADGGWFFDSQGNGCGLKAYTLTYRATMPDHLPTPDDPQRKRMTEEAIDLVNSIHYKRCPPAR